MPPAEPGPRRVARLRAWLSGAQDRAAGRVLVQTLEDVARVEIFDRAMTLAAQIFTSVFPVLILLGVFIDRTDAADLSSGLSVPPATQNVLESATNSASGSIGIVGAFFVLVSATSLSRALGRMYSAVWQLPRPRSSLRSAWRWLAVVIAFALSLIVVRGLVRWSSGLFLAPAWAFGFVWVAYAALLLGCSYVLLLGRVSPRRLLPGAVLGGAGIAILTRVGSLFLTSTLEASEDRYGVIGVAFTYLGFLYAIAFAVIGTAVFGAVLVRGEESWSVWLRGARED